MRVGVLALQGDVSEHVAALGACGAEAVEVRTAGDLAAVEALILPGGESTTIGRLLERFALLEPLRQRARSGLPVWGTCAGMILLAREVHDAVPGQPLLGLMDLEVVRNAYGRQRDSFQVLLEVPALGEQPFPAVFIRAPRALRAGVGVEVLARHEGSVAAARQGNLLATAFHPELTEDRRFHRFFLEEVAGATASRPPGFPPASGSPDPSSARTPGGAAAPRGGA